MNKPIKTAVIDLYNNEENQGMRCIKDILHRTDCKYYDVPLEYDVFDARHKGEVPCADYDIYISSGGPGSPFSDEGSDWERRYFELIDLIITNNANPGNSKKHILFICHSFQIMTRYFKFAEVTKRNSYSFGIMPVHKTDAGKKDFMLERLSDIFYAADFRAYQVIQPNHKRLEELGAEILCIEKERTHVDYERAVMAVRISDEIVGTQFHPEADAPSMYHHFRKPERKLQVTEKHGEEKYFEMLRLLEDPKAILHTQKIVIPNFLQNAVESLRPEEKNKKAV